MHLDMFRLRRGSGQHWQRVFRGAGPGEDDGWFWTPCPLAALTFVERDGRQLLVGTLRLGDLVFRTLDDWNKETPHLGDAPPPQDGTDIQVYRDLPQSVIFWNWGESRRVNDGETHGPEVQPVNVLPFTAYRLVSEKARGNLKIVSAFPYSDKLIADVLTASGTSARRCGR